MGTIFPLSNFSDSCNENVDITEQQSVLRSIQDGVGLQIKKKLRNKAKVRAAGKLGGCRNANIAVISSLTAS